MDENFRYLMTGRHSRLTSPITFMICCSCHSPITLNDSTSFSSTSNVGLPSHYLKYCQNICGLFGNGFHESGMMASWNEKCLTFWIPAFAFAVLDLPPFFNSFLPNTFLALYTHFLFLAVDMIVTLLLTTGVLRLGFLSSGHGKNLDMLAGRL